MSPIIGSSKLSIDVPAQVLKDEPVVFFSKQFLDRLPESEFEKIEKIVAADPYLNGGLGQQGDKVLVASSEKASLLVERYSQGDLITGEKIEPLSAEAKIAFKSLVAWFIAYRSSFPDPSETEPLENHVSYLKLSRQGEMKWGICVRPDPETGKVMAAFSGQVLEIESRGQGLSFSWGEHLFVPADQRGRGLGKQTLTGFETQLSNNFDKTACTIIEVDNPYGILDHKDPLNKEYFDHSNIDRQRQLWTDPEGQNMAMNPFERMRVWHKLGFTLIAVERKDLENGQNSVAFPYNQVPLAAGAEPCETIFLAIRVQDPKVREALEAGRMGVSEINKMYAAMQATVTESYAEEAAYRASQKEIQELVGADASVRLIPFCLGKGKELNPEALKIMQSTAGNKLTVERYQEGFEAIDLSKVSGPAIR